MSIGSSKRPVYVDDNGAVRPVDIGINVKFIGTDRYGNLVPSDDLSSIISAIYPVGSVYLDMSGSSTCPIASLIKGSVWSKVATKILVDVSSVGVAGNGMTIGLTDGEVYGGLSGSGDGYNSALANGNTYGKPIGTTYNWTEGYIRNRLSVGLTEDPEKSGIVVKFSENSSITVNIWKRTA